MRVVGRSCSESTSDGASYVLVRFIETRNLGLQKMQSVPNAKGVEMRAWRVQCPGGRVVTKAFAGSLMTDVPYSYYIRCYRYELRYSVVDHSSRGIDTIGPVVPDMPGIIRMSGT